MFFWTWWGPWICNLIGQVLEVDPRHPMTFCKEAKPLVWVLAECLVLTENMQMPNEVKVKMDAMGYALKNEPGFRCGQLPNETSHQYVETASKLKIAANIFRKQHRKRQAPKPAQKCPHCGKEARSLVVTECCFFCSY